MTWWLKPGWKAARCSCGANIWESGGDPDWGECYECFSRSVHEARECHEPEPEYKCDICGGNGACATVNGYAVCSQGCSDEAEEAP